MTLDYLLIGFLGIFYSFFSEAASLDNEKISRALNFLRQSGNERVSYKECNLDPGLRIDCGYYGIDDVSCYKRGCCYGQIDTEGVPWCYYSKYTIEDKCMLEVEERLECGFYGVRKEQCMAKNCCWQPKNEHGVPWCYHVRQLPVFDGECGVPPVIPKVDMRIVGGVEARPHSWPWQVSLQNYGHACGGSIINNNYIVSAAHCAPVFSSSNKDDNLIVAGLHHQHEHDEYFQQVVIDEVIVHEDYEEYGDSNDHDIMLLKLQTPLTFTDAVLPICLPDQGQPFDSGLKCYTTGWGDLKRGGSSPDELHQVQVPLIGNDVCNQHDWYDGEATDNMICAGYEEGGRDSCQGDSGGPLVCYLDDHWVLTGITSWGDGCADELKPGIYTKVSNYIHWIERQISNRA